MVSPSSRGGHVDAQYNLGGVYEQGVGVPQDYAEAVKWYRLAAEQGHASAQHNLGILYREGRGVPQDDAEAVKWTRLGAEQGDANAQYNLGLMYALGRGDGRTTWRHLFGSISKPRGFPPQRWRNGKRRFTIVSALPR